MRAMDFKLLYRIIIQDDNAGAFEDSKKLKGHEGRTVNIVIGMSGSGKTSMIQLSSGGEETDVRTKSETQDPVLIHDRVNNKLWLDTAGMCDSSDDPERKVLLRDAILNSIKQYKLKIGRIFVCVACDQNMDVNLAHEYVAFKKALHGSESMTIIVITKVNRPNRARSIGAAGGLKDQLSSAFGCDESSVILHGYDRERGVVEHAVNPSFQIGIDHGDIGTVTENAELKRQLQVLQEQFNRLERMQTSALSGNERVTQNIKDLYETIDAAENTLDKLLSENWCGHKNSDIKKARETIAKARSNIQENECKFRENLISATEASRSCAKTHSDIVEAKQELEDRMQSGLGLSMLAGAAKVFRDFFVV